VTWEWGTGRGRRLNLLYGGVYGPGTDRSAADAALSSPFFLTLVDSFGVKQVLRFNKIDYEGARPVAGSARARAPTRLSLTGIRDADSVRLDVTIIDALATEMSAGEFRRVFLQMRGRFKLGGRGAGEGVADSGMGFFETYVTP
jgi:hypothetical protein